LVDVIAAVTSASDSRHRRRRNTDVTLLPTAKRTHAPAVDPLENTFGLREPPDQTATGVGTEAPDVPGVTPTGRLQRTPVWRLREIVPDVDSVTPELRRRISEVPDTGRPYAPNRLVLYVTPLMLAGLSLMLWFGVETLFHGEWSGDRPR